MIRVSALIPARETVFQCLYATLIGLLAVGSGMGLGYSAVALPHLRNSTDEPSLNTETSGLFASLVSIITPIGCISSIFVVKRGRRKTFIIGGTIDIIGWILITSSTNVPQLLIGRTFAGFANGLCWVPAHIYIVEISTVRVSRVLNACTSFFISSGCLLSYFFGYMIQDWRYTAVAILSVDLVSVLAITILLPETPHWFLLKGREKDARKSLLRLRGLKESNLNFDIEFNEMVAHMQSHKNIQNIEKNEKAHESNGMKIQSSSGLINLSLFQIFKKPEVWKPFVILNIFFFLQNFSGITVLTAYTVDIVRNSGVTLDPFMATVIMGLAQTIAGITLMTCSFRMGRRHTAMFSSIIISASYILLGIYKQYFENTHESSIPLACLLIIETVGTVGFTNLPWTMLGELYPSKYVHMLGPLTICFCSLENFVVLQFYPVFVEYSFIATIYTFCGFTLIGTLYFALVLPETAGVSKINIEKQFKKEEN